jgi:integrase
VTDDDVAKVIHICLQENSPAALRDAALICLIQECKLDGKEIEQLQYQNLERDRQQVWCPLPKRNCQLSVSASKVIERWLAVRGDGAGPLLSTLQAAGNLSGRPLRKTTADVAIRRRGKQAGLMNLTATALRNANSWP